MLRKRHQRSCPTSIEHATGEANCHLGEARRIYSQLKSENFNQARGGRANFNPTNVQSIRIETPGANFQPGMDLWFADKQFGAVLPGTVKEIRPNNGRYGNMIVVESIDTKTGNPVDVIYAHLNSINVREGQRINIGTVQLIIKRFG